MYYYYYYFHLALRMAQKLHKLSLSYYIWNCVDLDASGIMYILYRHL